MTNNFSILQDNSKINASDDSKINGKLDFLNFINKLDNDSYNASDMPGTKEQYI